MEWTPYADINGLLERLRAGIQQALGEEGIARRDQRNADHHDQRDAHGAQIQGFSS